MEHSAQTVALDVCAQGYLMSLATVDSDGVWVADVIYVHDDAFNLYWMSKPHRRHSLAIKKNAQAACSITVNHGPQSPDMGLQISGRVEQVDEIDFTLVQAYMAKREKPEPQEGDDVLGDHEWYRLVPERIELIHAEQFDRERQTVR